MKSIEREAFPLNYMYFESIIPEGTQRLEKNALPKTTKKVSIPSTLKDYDYEVFKDCSKLQVIVVSLNCPVLEKLLKDKYLLKYNTMFFVQCTEEEKEQNKDLIENINRTQEKNRVVFLKNRAKEKVSGFPHTLKISGMPKAKGVMLELKEWSLSEDENWYYEESAVHIITIKRSNGNIEEIEFRDNIDAQAPFRIEDPSTIIEIKVPAIYPHISKILNDEELLKNQNVVYKIAYQRRGFRKKDYFRGLLKADEDIIKQLENQNRLKFEEETRWIEKYSGKPAERIFTKKDVPENVEHYEIPRGVTIIGEKAFAEQKNLKSITIPPTVKKICKRAFEGCENLTSVTLNEGLRTIEDCAFFKCKSLKSITIPSTIQKICESCFMYCSNLETVEMIEKKHTIHFESRLSSPSEEKRIVTVELLEGVEKIDFRAFEYCSSLRHIKLPNSIKRIESCAFEHCRSLREIDIPSSIQYLGCDVFSECRELADIRTANSLKCDIWPVFWRTKQKSETVPEGVKILGSSPNFYPNTFILKEFPELDDGGSLEILHLPSTLKSIGPMAFPKNLNTNLKEITIPVESSAILEVLENPVLLNTNVSFVIKYTNKTEIEKELCEELEPVRNLKEQGRLRFDKQLKIETTDEPTKSTILTSDDVPKTVVNYKVPYGTTEIAAGAFSDCIALKQVIIPDTVRIIGSRAFAGCKSLNEILIPPRVEKIGEFCFFNCSSLEKATILGRVKKIDGDTFAYNVSLKEVYLPNSVTTIGSWAFELCRELEQIKLPTSVTRIDNNAFGFCTSLKKVKLPEWLKYISAYAFAQSTALDKIELPDELQVLREHAFLNSTALEEITIPASVKELYPESILELAHLKKLIIKYNSLEELEIFVKQHSNTMLNKLLANNKCSVEFIGPELEKKEKIAIIMLLSPCSWAFKTHQQQEPQVDEDYKYTGDKEFDRIINNIYILSANLYHEDQDLIDIKIRRIIKEYKHSRKILKPSFLDEFKPTLPPQIFFDTRRIKRDLEDIYIKLENNKEKATLLEHLSYFKALINKEQKAVNYTDKKSFANTITGMIVEIMEIAETVLTNEEEDIKRTLLGCLTEIENHLKDYYHNIFSDNPKDNKDSIDYAKELEKKVMEILEYTAKNAEQCKRFQDLLEGLEARRTENNKDNDLLSDINTTRYIISSLRDENDKQRISAEFEATITYFINYIKKAIKTKRYKSINYSSVDTILRGEIYKHIISVIEAKSVVNKSVVIQALQQEAARSLQRQDAKLQDIKNEVKTCIDIINGVLQQDRNTIQTTDGSIVKIVLEFYDDINNNQVLPDAEKKKGLQAILLAILAYQVVLISEECTQENNYQITRLIKALAENKRKLYDLTLRYRDYLEDFPEEKISMH